jgi:predicted phage terminase large subunit-like protein
MKEGLVPAFQEWIRTKPGSWTWDWKHQLYLYGRLDRVTAGETKRLMILMPPRHSKSETVTVRYTAWRMIRDTQMNVIIGSYNQRLANRFSRKIRKLVDGPIALSKDRKAASEWETKAGGSLCAVGVGAGVTGFGADLIVIDDPVKNRSEAESKAYRENTWDWFNDDIYTRLEPGAAIILIQTRWHEDDLAGRLLTDMKNGGEQWEVISLPALSVPPAVAGGLMRSEEYVTQRGSGDNQQPPATAGGTDWRAPGEALCPDRYDVEALRRIEKKLGSYSFAALYQQNPVPLDGGIFKRSWFKRIVEKAPDDLKWFRGYDLAVSTATAADFTASVRCAIDKQGNIYIADAFRARIEFPDQRRYVIERMTDEKDTVHGIESALHGQGLVQDILRETKLLRHVLRSIRANKDKVTRALPWAAKAESGKVILVRGPWIDEFLEEVCSFPNGAHDDQVDAMSLAFRMMTERKKVSAGF